MTKTLRARRVNPRSANARHHAEWRALLDISGPFLSLPVLDRAFPQGLEAHSPDMARLVRQAYAEWQDGTDDARTQTKWVETVLRDVLELPKDLLVSGATLPKGCEVRLAQHHETLRPNLALVSPNDRSDAGAIRLPIHIVPRGQDLEKPLQDGEWKASPATRMTELLRGLPPSSVKLGLVTNGEHWMLIYAPRDETAGYATWLAALWTEEPLTLRAWRSLLGVRRLFSVGDAETLEALYAASSKDQQEVTEQLGLQVRRAIEILVQALDRVDKDRGRQLLSGFDEKELYSAVVTTMMRLVFLLYAEEQQLLPIDDPFYSENYAVSSLLERLQEDGDSLGEEVLERRHAAWNRLLATFRAVYGGVEHEAMRLPPYGGGLFDPDRYPFLEGRERGSRWQEKAALPLPIDDRTVLDILRSLQFLEVLGLGEGVEAQRLSFKALGVEQIGHVYESLLDHTAVRAKAPVLGLGGSKQPEIPLEELEKLSKKGRAELIEYVAEETGRSASAVEDALDDEVDVDDGRWLQASGNDSKLLARVRPLAGLVRQDSRGFPVVVEGGGLYVTKGSDRRSTGTHYTPRSLTEPIVQYALEPLVYEGPAEGRPEEEWTLRSATQILELKVCDMACGSGAFLVQACRYLSERLVEAWSEAEARNPGTVVITPEGELSEAQPEECVIPRDVVERLAVARRLVADRCLYGVDVNPMAVEMAKLSLWLVTLQKHRPFSFLDHAIKCGDSLLGITNVRQVEYLSLEPESTTGYLFLSAACRIAVAESQKQRRTLQAFPVLDIRGASEKYRRLDEANRATATVRAIGNLVVGLELIDTKSRSDYTKPKLERVERLLQELTDRQLSLEGRRTRLGEVILIAAGLLDIARWPERRPFHWPLEFPEVFGAAAGEGGFDAFVGNPPFMYGTLATTALGQDYMTVIQRSAPPWHGKTDLSVAFFRRAAGLLAPTGTFALVGTSSILRGESQESGLKQLLRTGFTIYQAKSPFIWPGTASTEVVCLWLSRGWRGTKALDGVSVESIGPDLSPVSRREPQRLLGATSLHGMLGVKLSPENRERPRAELSNLAGRAGSLMRVTVPVIGGEELYNLLDLKDAPRAVDPGLLVGLSKVDLADLARMGLQPERVAHSAPAKGLTELLAQNPFAFACGETAVHLAFRRVPTRGVLLKHKLIVFPAESWAVFAILQAEPHVSWAWKWGLRREQRLVYSPKRCAETYPVPELTAQTRRVLDQLAREYEEGRERAMLRGACGLTALYNRFHDASARSREIQLVRTRQVELDVAVVHSYGWSDLKLEHGFHQTQRGVRFSPTESACRLIIDRLLELNAKVDRIETTGVLKENLTESQGPASVAGSLFPLDRN